MTPALVQFKGDLACPICADPTAAYDLVQNLLENDTPDVLALSRQYGVSPKELLRHLYECCAPSPYVTRTQINAAATDFAENVVNSLARTINRAEQILNELFDYSETDDDTGEIIYPNRSINLALAYNQIAKTHAQTLDGIVAAGQRKQIAQRLEQLETQSRPIEATPLSAAPQARPSLSVAALLGMAPEIDPLS